MEVHRRGLDLIQPGARCCDIALELNEMYRYNVFFNVFMYFVFLIEGIDRMYMCFPHYGIQSSFCY